MPPPLGRMRFDSCRRGAPYEGIREALHTDVGAGLPSAPSCESVVTVSPNSLCTRLGMHVASSVACPVRRRTAQPLRVAVIRPGHRRTASATCTRPSPTAAVASSTRRPRRALHCPRRSGRESPAPRGRGCTLPSSTMPAVGRGTAAGQWRSTATARPCRPGGPPGTQQSLGQFRWSYTRSPRWVSAPGRGSSGRRGCVCTGSRPRLGRASTTQTSLIFPPIEPAVGTVEPPEQPATVTPRATAAAAHRCDGRKTPRFDTTRPQGVVSEGLSPASCAGSL